MQRQTFYKAAGLLTLGLLLGAPLSAPVISHAEDAEKTTIPYVRENPAEEHYTIRLVNGYINQKQQQMYNLEGKYAEATDNIPIITKEHQTIGTFDDAPYIEENSAGTYVFHEGSIFKSLRTKNISDLLPVPQSRGYDFLGWSMEDVAPGDYDEDEANATVRQYFNSFYKKGLENTADLAESSYDGEIVFYPIFDEAKIKIRYHLQQADGTFKDVYYADSIYTFGNPKALVTPLANELPVGYSFIGWYKDEGLTNAVVDDSVFAPENVKTVDVNAMYPDYYIDVYGKVVPAFGTVTFNAKGGTLALKEMHYTYFSHEIPIPVKEKNLFAGWYEDAAYTIAVTDSTFAKGGDMTIYAKWNKISLKKPTVKLKNKKKGKITVTLKKTGKVDGIVVQMTQNRKFSKYSKIQEKEFKGNVSTATVNKAKKGNTYYIRTKTYKKDSVGNKVYSKWSSVKKIKVKK